MTFQRPMNRLPKFVCRCHCRRSFYSNFRRGEKRRRRRTVPWGTDRSSFAYWPCVRRHIPIRHRRPIDLPTCSAVQRININILPLFFSFSFVPDSYLPICLACDLWRAEVSNIFPQKKKKVKGFKSLRWDFTFKKKTKTRSQPVQRVQ